MKALYLLFAALIGGSSTLTSQILSDRLSVPRQNDILHKIQVDYTTSGERGKDAIWDFSNISFTNKDYKVTYFGKLDSIMCMDDGETRYKYHLSSDSLLFLGYENANLKIDNLRPILAMKYPFAYGDSIHSFFYGKGSYGHSLDMTTYGHTYIKADGCGTLLLPEKDTLVNVLRTHQVKFIGQAFMLDNKKQHFTDSIACLSDTILSRLQEDSVTWCVENYQWYAPGYRYPIFETMENTICRDGKPFKHFNIAFFYPPGEQLYLETDEDNQYIREKEKNEMGEGISYKNKKNDSSLSKSPSDLNLTTSITSEGNLVYTYQTNEEVKMEMMLTTISGIVLYHLPSHIVRSGTYSNEINIPAKPDKELIFCIIINGKQDCIKIIR